MKGNRTRDPLLSETPRGTAVCNLSIATNRQYHRDEQKQQEVSLIDVETWAKTPEGRKRSRVKIVAEHVEFRPVRPRDTASEASEEQAEEQTTLDTEKEASC